MSIYKPTWLYIKQHNQTGLKYFGMTSCKYVNSYRGSGKYWKLHLAKHGYDVSTPWAQLFTDEHKLKEYARIFSEENNIVESAEWANLVPESGCKTIGSTGWKHTNEAKEAIRLSSKSRPPTFGMLDHKHKQESKDKTSKTLTGRLRPDVTPTAKKWVITSTTSTETVVNLRGWCKSNDINYQLAHRYALNGKPYKGYLITEGSCD